MTFNSFNQLSDEEQLACVYQQGYCLARRWDDMHQAVKLYQLPGGFFEELNYDVDRNEITYHFAFEAGSEEDRSEDYAMFVKLLDWLGLDK